MLLVFKHLPLRLNGGVALHVHMALAPLEAVLLVDGYQVIEKQRISTFGAVLREYADE